MQSDVCIRTHVHNIQKLVKKRKRTAVNAASLWEIPACHFGHAWSMFVSPGVEARLRTGLPSHVSIPRFGQFYTPKRPGRLWRPPSSYPKAPGALSLWERGRSMKLTTHLHLVRKYGMSGTISPFPHILLMPCTGTHILYLYYCNLPIIMI